MIEVWMHRETGRIVLAAKLFTEQENILPRHEGPMYLVSLYHVLGYGIETQEEIMRVLPLSIKDQFEVIGEW